MDKVFIILKHKQEYYYLSEYTNIKSDEKLKLVQAWKRKIKKENNLKYNEISVTAWESHLYGVLKTTICKGIKNYIKGKLK